MGGLLLGVNTLYMLSCFLEQFALVGKGLNCFHIHLLHPCWQVVLASCWLVSAALHNSIGLLLPCIENARVAFKA